MHWMYLNREAQDIPDVVAQVESSFANASIETSLGNIVVSYDARLWSNAPIVERKRIKLIWCGWFVYCGQVNPLELIFNDIQKHGLSETLQRIDAGIFVGAYQCDGEVTIFNDWFGLAAHFYRIDDNNMWLSPFARTVSNEGRLDESYAQYLANVAHLWGQHTKFQGVKRLTPSAMLSCAIDSATNKLRYAQQSYGDFKMVKPLAIADIPAYIKQITDLFPSEHKYISLSAGFDSRVIALVASPSFSYTWGPLTSKDAHNGKAIATALNIPWMNFNFGENAVEDIDKEIDQLLTESQIQQHDTQFFRNYRHVAETLRASGASQFIVLDGFLGDGLQRGTYCYGGSIRSEIKKIFPALFTGDSTEQILRDRYRALPENVRNALLESYKKYDFRGLDFSKGAQRVTAFECMNNRCYAYIYSGGIAANSVWNVVVPPFTFSRIFKALVEQPVADVTTYKVFKKLWSQIQSPLKSLPSEGLYSPSTPRLLIPFFNFIGRVATNYIPLFTIIRKEEIAIPRANQSSCLN